jgi:hypothetical protein
VAVGTSVFRRDRSSPWSQLRAEAATEAATL